MLNISAQYIEPLIAVLFGFLLSQATEYIKNNYKEADAKRNSRLLLTLETKKNYRLFSTFWSEINRQIEEFKSSDTDNDKRIKRLTSVLICQPLPAFKQDVWNSLINELPKNFSMREINKYWDFYETLIELNTIQKTLISKNIKTDIEFLKNKNLIYKYQKIAINLADTSIWN